jgi:23S rRNA pseudouridine1911/1915/1917 synthase
VTDGQIRNEVAVLYTDEHLVIVDKPAGMVVHPTYKNPEATLLDLLRQVLPDPPAIVGRLDQWTSGLVVVARNSVVHAGLQRAMAATDCRKEYLAVVHGSVVDSSTFDLRLQVSPDDRRRVVVSAESGTPSVTRVEPLATTRVGRATLSLLRCTAVTGRRHQIRAHLAAGGWPIVGDATYGDPSRDRMLDTLACACRPRQALHAWRLLMTHPFSGAAVQVASPVPADLQPLARLFPPDTLVCAS